jgi:hypothetical protein
VQNWLKKEINIKEETLNNKPWVIAWQVFCTTDGCTAFQHLTAVTAIKYYSKKCC